jgi:hypothetical protein
MSEFSVGLIAGAIGVLTEEKVGSFALAKRDHLAYASGPIAGTNGSAMPRNVKER